MAHVCNLGVQEGKAGGLPKFKYSLSSRDIVSKTKQPTTENPQVQRYFFPLDFIVLAVWGMLAVSGITLQIRRERGQPPFPPHPYKLWKQERERRVTNILDPSHHIPPLRERLYGRIAHIKELFQREQPAGERTPLLL